MKTIEEQVAFLEEARTLTAELKSLEVEVSKKELEFKKYSKELSEEEKAVENSIEITIKKRKSALVKTFDGELEKSESMLKRAKSQRAAEKQKGQNKRLANETADIRDELRRYESMLKTSFKKDNAPSICNTRIFYTLTSPITFLDIVIDILLFVICFVGIPYLLSIIFEFSAVSMIIVYVAAIVFFGFIYYNCFLKIKIKHIDAVEYGKKIRRKMIADKRHIGAIKTSIKEDKNEDMYNLGGFDEQIEDISADKDRVAREKQAALDDFENNIKPSIIREIKAASEQRINELTNKRNEAKQLFDELSEKLQGLNIKVATDIQTVLGKDYNEEKLDYLIAYLESGQASTITEAENLYKLGTEVGRP